MAGITIKDIGQLKMLIEKSVQESLEKEVSDGIKEDLVDHAQLDVYDKYQPSKYIRRWSLKDKGKYETESSSMHLTITPRQEFNQTQEGNPYYRTNNFGDELSGLVNYGHGWGGYYYDYGAPPMDFAIPRPFIDNVEQEWNDGKLKDTLANALTAKGFTVK